jgi:hypothetical protein
MVKSMTRAKLTRMIEYDARNESPKVRAITRQALESIKELTASQIEDQQALEEDL